VSPDSAPHDRSPRRSFVRALKKALAITLLNRTDNADTLYPKTQQYLIKENDAMKILVSVSASPSATSIFKHSFRLGSLS
jgi:hypothetical protein